MITLAIILTLIFDASTNVTNQTPNCTQTIHVGFQRTTYGTHCQQQCVGAGSPL
jgi:hypothetical protein